MTMGAAQADLSIEVSTPMSTYRSYSLSAAPCIANANKKVFEIVVQLHPSAQRVALPLYNAESHLQTQLEIQRHVILCTRLNCIHFLLICKKRAKSFSCSECVDPILTHHIGRCVFGHSNNSFLVTFYRHHRLPF
ncbi:hypothetical protein T03_2207 [Trichinella britovi]|uniref:Uncharacterized protein n=1 Tax=Trichinella britovi TaxID=45882 RepID=A0A0V1CB41_TRIBR|nr:hypothetical protein T03_2207 [Trichinella britovi]